MFDDPFPLRASLRAECGEAHTVLPFTLDRGQSLRLGRKPRMESSDPGYHPDFGSDLVFPDDDRLSNFQATLTWDGQRLIVTNRPGAANALLDPDATGEPREQSSLLPGERFRIGETTFTFSRQPAPVAAAIPEATLSALRFSDPGLRLEALGRLPDSIRRTTDERMLECLLDAVLEGVPRANAVAIVEPAAAECTAVRVVQAKLRSGIHPPPSRQLVRRAILQYENISYVWPTTPLVGADAPTFRAEVDWAICVRFPGPHDEGLYISGHCDEGFGRPGELEEDVKFARLAADIFTGQRELRTLGREAQFLQRLVSQPVRMAIAGQSAEEVTAPREITATVLFCDLRGFTPLVERGQGNLRATWDRLSTALDKMTAAIVDHDGVVGDFQGDAVMGFWGWPIAQDDQIERAAKAALAIRRRFAGMGDRPDHPLADLLAHPAHMPCGIGLAHGPAVAGRLGSAEQVKIGLFGPVVNRAARLEAATKKLGVPIAIDEAVWKALTERGQGWCRTRRIARFRPQGIATPVLVSELLPPPQEFGPNLTESHRKQFEAAVDRFLGGDWPGCANLLRAFTADGPAAYLLNQIEQLRQPPPAWDGAIAIEK